MAESQPALRFEEQAQAYDAFANGGKAASELDYVPMPADVIATIQKSWGEIKDPAGKAISFK